MHQHLNQFHPITPAAYALLESRFTPRTCKRGEFLLQAGQVQRELYFVRSGVQMSYIEVEGKVHVMAFTYAPGFCAVPESFLMQAPSAYQLQCLRASTLEALSFEALQALYQESREIERLFHRLSELILVGVLTRHREMLTLGMEARFRAFVARSPHLLQLVPHKYIASYLGIDPTNFSKLYNSIRI